MRPFIDFQEQLNPNFSEQSANAGKVFGPVFAVSKCARFVCDVLLKSRSVKLKNRIFYRVAIN